MTGPTAVGKTELSIRWAEQNNAEILSCDSLLFYKGMDIGTAKPSAKERSRVTHHGIDLVESCEQFDIGRYLEYSKKVVEDIWSREKKVLITGGSGFYLKSFFAPVVDTIVIEDSVKNKVDQIFKFEGLDGLVQELKRRNQGEDFQIDLNNPRRVIPSLERCIQTGKSIRALRAEFESSDFPFKETPCCSCLLSRSKSLLHKRVSKRAQEMLENGLVEEVEKLIELGIKQNPSAANSIGYRESIEFLENSEMDEMQLYEKIVTNTNRLIKKQGTWFRTQIQWDQFVDLDTGVEVVDLLFGSP